MGGVVESLLAECLAAKYAQQSGSVIFVLDAFGQLDQLVPASGLGIELGERNGRVGRRLELLDDVNRAFDVTVLLLQLGERQADRVSVNRELGSDSLGDRQLEMRVAVAGDELVGCWILALAKASPSRRSAVA